MASSVAVRIGSRGIRGHYSLATMEDNAMAFAGYLKSTAEDLIPNSLVSRETWGHDTFICGLDFLLFKISADNHLCLRSYKETHFRTGQRERCLDSRSVELAMRFTTASLRNTLCRSSYVHKRSSKILHHG